MAIACAPPAAYTSSTPSRAHAASTVSSGSPPRPDCGGLATARPPTPAAWAATTFITTELGNTASPPGTYSPTRWTGTQRWCTLATYTTEVLLGCGCSDTCARHALRISN